jgi:hypothetical protein
MHETLGTNNNQAPYININFIRTVIGMFVASQKDLSISADPYYMMQHGTIYEFKHTSVWQTLLYKYFMIINVR